ncbi:MAG: hypothetical protein ACRC0C_04225 [Gibbsiella quercinecans]|uniref:hypothetical protein n=1 Tax=Gibbsiella quercinecans TaxID=929813 RepID=UPI003F4013CD
MFYKTLVPIIPFLLCGCMAISPFNGKSQLTSLQSGKSSIDLRICLEHAFSKQGYSLERQSTYGINDPQQLYYVYPAGAAKTDENVQVEITTTDHGEQQNSKMKNSRSSGVVIAKENAPLGTFMATIKQCEDKFHVVY